jgi:TRAP-type C4-dicarboxylate transport system permease large subunit
MQDFMNSVIRALRATALVLVRLVAGALGLVLMLGLMLFGLIAGSLLIAWALLRGRRPVMRFGSMPAGWPRHVRRGVGPATPASTGEVIDIEAREVTPSPPPDPR